MIPRFLALLVSLALWSVPASAAALSSFPLLQSKGAIEGYDDGSYRLWKPITRMEAIKVLVSSDPTLSNEARALASRQSGEVEWYAPYLRIARAREFIRGFPDGSLRPDSPLTVAEAVTLIHRSSRIRRTVPFLTSSYLRNEDGQWYTEAVSNAIAKKLIIEPLELSAPMKRSHFFALVERLRTAERNGLFAYAATIGQPMPMDARPEIASRKPFTVTIPALRIEDMDILHPEGFETQKEILAPLDAGLGHLFSFPGEGGKVLIYGHSSNWPWVTPGPLSKPFERLIDLKVNDRITITYEGKLYTYAVTSKKRHKASDLSSFVSDTSGEELILYTCWPPYSTRDRLLVHTRLLQTTELL
jgi:LPXTG-site transpeptidase (sortase) family protein